MSDLSIAQKFNKPISAPKSSNTTQINPAPQKKNKGLSTGVKVAIGTSLVALASYGIYVATKGKVKPKSPATTNNPVQEIKELAVSTFKEAGNKFIKGKAVLIDGTNYTGKIVSEGKDGSKVVSEYLDGVLQKSTKTKGTETIFEKTYKYSDDLGLVNVTKNGESIFKKYIDNAGNLNIRTLKHHTKIDKPTGLISINGKFIDKQKNITGAFTNPTVCTSQEYGGSYSYKIKGVEIPSSCISKGQEGFFPKGESNLHWTYKSRQNNNSFNVDNDYYFNSSGQSRRTIDLSAKYGEYRKLDYDFKTGLVTNGDTPLFNFNYRTNEITDLKIDKKEAEELVNFAKEQYKFYQKAQKAKLREYGAGLC